MKTLESILNNPERRLSAEEMREVKGGEVHLYLCHCGFSDKPGLMQYVTETDLITALNFMASACTGAGATCYGPGSYPE